MIAASETLARCPLFQGIEMGQMEALLGCINPQTRHCHKDEFVFRAGDEAASIGVVLRGGVRIEQEDFWGRRMILAHIGPAGVFGEALACAQKQTLPVSVAAAEVSDILLLDYRKIFTTCSSACVFHAGLIRNMVRVLAEKNIAMTRKMEYLSKRTTREKLLSFLSSQAQLLDSDTVEVPFNRQELADYLCVDRSALSRELGIMREEGILEYDKNRFELKRGKSVRVAGA